MAMVAPYEREDFTRGAGGSQDQRRAREHVGARSLANKRAQIMSRRPAPRRRGSPSVNALGWQGLPGKSKRYRNISDSRYPIGATISNRQMSNLKREDRLGRKISKETYTKAIRKRELRYADAATELRQTNARNSRFIRGYLPEIAPKDKTIALK